MYYGKSLKWSDLCCFHLRDLKSPFGLQISKGVPAAYCTRNVLEIAAGSQGTTYMAREAQSNLWSQKVLGFDELLSELIARARMLRPHLGSRVVSAPLTFGVHCPTLPGEERCGRMIANPVTLAYTSTTPQLSVRAGADACL